MNKEQQNQRRTDSNVKYITERICRHDGGKPYVFISYKSDEWGTVLGEIVYELVKKHGLNVYFDADFNKHNALWTKQFTENMESEYCKGVLAFVDDKYSTSYATLLELLYSQVGCYSVKPPYRLEKKPVVTVNLGKFTMIQDNSDTGLGIQTYENGEQNIHWKDELKLFKTMFDYAKEEKLIKDTVRAYEKTNKLSKALCSAMCKEVLQNLETNDNYIYEGITIQDIVETIRSQCGDEVFCPIMDSDPDLESGLSVNVTSEKDDDIVDSFLNQDFISKGVDTDKKDPVGADTQSVVKTNSDYTTDKVFPNNDVEVDFKDDAEEEKNEKWIDSLENKIFHSQNDVREEGFNEDTTLAEFEKICENVEFCKNLGRVRNNTKKGMKTYFDYFMASLLGGCDSEALNSKKDTILRLAAYNYIKQAVSTNPEKTGKTPLDFGFSQGTWSSNARKAIRPEDLSDDYYSKKTGKLSSGKLWLHGDIFAELSRNLTIGDVLKKYKNQEKGFNTNNNEMIFRSWELIKGLSNR